MSLPPDDWLPFYPDRPPRPPRTLIPGGMTGPPYTTDAFPVTDVLASLTFLPSYPDQVPHVRTPRAVTTFADPSWILGGLHPLAWAPVYPDQLPIHRPQQPPYATDPPPGPLVVVAQSLTWLAVYPATVPTPPRQVPAGLTWTIPPEVPAAAEPCVDLVDDGLTAPTLLAEALTAPTLLGEGLDSPTLSGEDLC